MMDRSDEPLLFEVPAAAPTTRQIALLVKERGPEALTNAQKRADDARYQEVRCRSALNRVEGMPFNWTLNPYRGCTHGCHYCFARRYQTQFELGSGDEFSSVIFVKANLPAVLRRELDRPTWTRELVAVGTATDPYQPIEGHYRLTRQALEALAAASTPVGIVTKGPMVVRDKDVLLDLSRRAGCTVYMSVPSVDTRAWEELEPGTASPHQRLEAVRKLSDAGIDAGVLMAPILPGITSSPAALEATIKAIADHGAAFMGANVLYLQDGTRDHFMRILAERYPSLVAGYQRLYAGKYAPRPYVNRVRSLIAVLESRYGVSRRRRRGEGGTEAPPDGSPDRQAAFEWTRAEGS